MSACRVYDVAEPPHVFFNTLGVWPRLPFLHSDDTHEQPLFIPSHDIRFQMISLVPAIILFVAHSHHITLNGLLALKESFSAKFSANVTRHDLRGKTEISRDNSLHFVGLDNRNCCAAN